MPEILICGAGRIGRGFVAQLFHHAGWRVSFADSSVSLAAALRATGGYRIEIAGRPELGERIPVADAVSLSDAPALSAAVARADLLACAVGAPNLVPLARALAPALTARDHSQPFDWLICENADAPAQQIRTTLSEGAEPGFAAWVATRLGLVETQVLRSGLTADSELLARDPLTVRMHDWWTLPCDGEAFRGPIPVVTGLQPRSGFARELQRKLYTFNGLNGPIAYLGWANGERILHQAVLAPALQPLLAMVREESIQAVVRGFAVDQAEQRAFQDVAWRKYTDPALNDSLERNARDSARKLGTRERLVGPALLALEHGITPHGYAAAICAAIAYDGSDDPGTKQVQADLAAGGPVAVLQRHAGLASDHPLTRLVLAAWAQRVHLVAKELV